jgi:hypothetical protein
MTVTNQNMIHEEIKRRLNSGSACYHSDQNLLSSRLLSKNVKIRIYRTGVCNLTLKEVHRLKVFENRVLFDPKRDKVVEG